MARNEKIHLRVSEDDEEIVAYLTLPDHPGRLSAIIKKSVRLRDLIGDYTGPDLYFDFDEDQVLLGIEILD